MTLPKDYVLDAEIQAKGLDWMTAEIKRLTAERDAAINQADAARIAWDNAHRMMGRAEAEHRALVGQHEYLLKQMIEERAFHAQQLLEINRLRAALEKFLACFNCSEWEDEPMVFAAMTAAREALAGGGK